MAESRVLFLSRESGKPVTDGWRSVVLGQYRRFFSVLFVKVQAACLSARIGHLGLQAREAAGRRRDMMMQEERSRREANAYFAIRKASLLLGGRKETRKKSASSKW